MKGEPVMVMLVEDNLDHAELVMRTLEVTALPIESATLLTDKLRWIIFFVAENFRTLRPARVHM